MSKTGYTHYKMRTAVHSAPGAIIRLPALFESLGAKRVVLLSDQGLKDVGIVSQIEQVFAYGQLGKGAQLVGTYTDIAPDAACATVNGALKFAREVAADAILAVGGGSVLDASKGVKYALHHKLLDIKDAVQAGAKFEVEPQAKPMNIPHIGVPTTAGTGAEVSNIAVLYNEESGIKGALIVPYIEPDIAVLDPNLSKGLPAFLTASTGMDALTHALEGIASPMANHFSDAHTITAAQLIEKNLPIVVTNGQDTAARTAMLEASSMAINGMMAALNAAPIHNCSHAFGALFHIPHGDANAVLLPICLEVLADFYLPNAHRLALALNLRVAENEGNEQALEAVIERVNGLQQELACHSTFAKWNVQATDAERITQAIASDPAGIFYPIPTDKVQAIIAKTIG